MGNVFYAKDSQFSVLGFPIESVEVLEYSTDPDGRIDIPGVRDRWSPSQIKSLLRCGAQYMYKYLDKLPDTWGSAAFIGNCVHAGAEQYLKTLRDGSSDITEKESLEIALDGVRAYYDRQKAQDKIKDVKLGKRWYRGPNDTEASMLTDALTATTLLVRCILPDVGTPIEVERGYLIRWSDNTYPILCYPDLVSRKNGKEIIFDWKTSGRPKEVIALEDDIALSFYAAARSVITGNLIEKAYYGNVIRTSPMTTAVLEVPITADSLRRAYRATRVVQETVNRGLYAPRWDGDGICKYCDFREHCHKDWGQLSSVQSVKTISKEMEPKQAA